MKSIIKLFLSTMVIGLFLFSINVADAAEGGDTNQKDKEVEKAMKGYEAEIKATTDTKKLIKNSEHFGELKLNVKLPSVGKTIGEKFVDYSLTKDSQGNEIGKDGDVMGMSHSYKFKGGIFQSYLGLAYLWVAGIVGSIAVVIGIIGGILIATGGANSGNVSTGKNMIGSAIGGIVVIVLAGVFLKSLNPAGYDDLSSDDAQKAYEERNKKLFQDNQKIIDKNKNKNDGLDTVTKKVWGARKEGKIYNENYGYDKKYGAKEYSDSKYKDKK